MKSQNNPGKNIFSRIVSKITSLPVYVLVIIGTISVAAELIRRFVFGGGCLLKDIFGIACPSCGMSRAFWCVMKLDFKSAFHFNPAFWTFPLMCIFGVLLAADKQPGNRTRRMIWGIVFSVLVLIFFGVWVYRLITGTTV